MFTKITLLSGLLALASPLASAVELSFIRGPLQSTGADPDASGFVRSIFKGADSRLWATLRGLEPGASYELTVDGTAEASFVADAQGRACVKFRVSGTGDTALDFDPRGKEIAITSGTSNVLSMIYSGQGESTALIVDERTDLTPAEGSATEGRVRARYLDQRNKTRFIVQFLGMTRGTYTLRVDGTDVATVDLNRGRSATVRFETNGHSAVKSGNGNGNGNTSGGAGKGKNRYSLDFDPRGKLIEVLSGNVVVYSDVMLAKVHGLPTETTEVVPLVAAPADPDAAGNAEIVTSTNGDQRLTVAVSNIPAGDYDVLIGGTARGILTVVDNAGVTSGEIIFDNEPAEGEVLLDFPLTGAIEISQAGTVFLSATLP